VVYLWVCVAFTAFNSEEVWISGGVSIAPAWKPFRVTKGANVYVADLSPWVPRGAGVYGLRENGNRMIRARYPNANPEHGFGSTLLAKAWVPTVLPNDPAIEVRVCGDPALQGKAAADPTPRLLISPLCVAPTFTSVCLAAVVTTVFVAAVITTVCTRLGWPPRCSLTR
jgi:hypothetical protein